MSFIKDELVYCKNCNEFTNQLLINEDEDLVIVGNDSLSQNYCCGKCHEKNTRILHKCFKCNCFRKQTLVKEEKNMLMANTIDQEFRCCYCGNFNRTSRDSNDEISRFVNEFGV